MRAMLPTFTLPIAALAACLFASGAAIAQSVPAAPEIEKVDLCPDGQTCGTARLKGFDVTFDFNNHAGNTIGYTYQCEGMKYPEQPWPGHCTISFSGPEIDKRFGKELTLEFDSPKVYTFRDSHGRRIIIPNAKQVTTASILPGRGCVNGGKCVATFEGYGEIIFEFNNHSGNTFGYTWECEKGLDYPAKPWPKGCSISPRPIWRSDDSYARDIKEECSPVCVVHEH